MKFNLSKLLLASTLIVGVAAVLSVKALREDRRQRAEAHAAQQAPPIKLRLPDFELTASDGQPVSRKSLRGRVWIADFIFTHCAGPCPLMTRHMRALQDDLADVEPLTLVSFSVDPAHDTPQVLTEYAERHGARAGRWLFVTGSMDQIYDLAIDGFRIAVAAARKNNQIIHDTRFMLVDQDGYVRGYYDSDSEDDLRQLRRDAERMAAR